MSEDNKTMSAKNVDTDGIEQRTTSTSEAVGEVRPKKHFSLLAALGVQFSVTGAPLTIGSYLSLAVGLGGSAGYFWGFLMVGFFQLVVCLAVCELASAIPHSSGPAHWVLVLAPPNYSRGLAYFTGWATTSAWILITAASYLYPAQLVLALVSASHPEYVEKVWHVYLLYVAFSLFCLSFNLPYAFRSLKWLLKIAIFAYNGSALYMLIALLVRAAPKQNAHDVFFTFINESGWSSNGLVFFMGLLPAITTLAGFDNAIHLADEMDNPGKQLPQVLIGSLLLSYVVGLAMIIVYQFSNVDPVSLLTPVGGQPIVQLVFNAVRSLPLTIIGVTLVVICFTISAIATLLSVSRLYWSFSREGNLPLHNIMSRLSSSDQLPVNALIWITGLVVALGTIVLGSTIAMNALLGGAGICITMSMITCFALVLGRGRERLNPDRWFNLGSWGSVVYVIALLWAAFTSIVFCLPLYLPVTAETMNYTSVIFVGVLALGAIYWAVGYSKRAVTSSGDEVRATQVV
ncbi:hypothetical protein ACEPPN_012148 [Leptodophora sp. 'Broadleaf-Isolate-01']